MKNLYAADPHAAFSATGSGFEPSLIGIGLRAIAAFAFLSCMPASASEGPGLPAGLVVKIVGQTEPQLDIQEELLQGVTYRLSADTRVVFVRYGACGSFVATGGSLVVSSTAAANDGGRLESGAGPCTQLHSLAFNTNPGVFVTRGAALPGVGSGLATGLPQFPRRPSLILTGPNARRVASAEIVAASAPAAGRAGQAAAATGRGMLMQRVGREIRLTDTTPDLAPNATYEIRLIVSSGAPLPPYRFMTTTESTSSAIHALRID